MSAAVAPIIHDIGVAIAAATVLGLAAHWTRQPIILAYLVAGALVGPIGFGWIDDQANIAIISELGMILLLFVIGLEMDLKQVAASGRQLLLTGLGQFPLGAALGAGLFWLLGWGLGGGDASGLYLALICSLSSTAIVVKLLYDTRTLDTLAGRITVGVLVIQDVWAILVLALQPNLTSPELLPIAKAVGGSLALTALGVVASRLLLHRVFAAIAHAPEMVVAAAIGWCAIVAGAAGAMGLSTAMGALIAGVAVGSMPYRLHVVAKVLPLRDFFLTLFFVSIGMMVVAPEARWLPAIAVAVLFTVASRFLTVWPLLALSGAGHRTGFLASLNLAQVSEFGLVIALLGVGYGHIGQDTFNVVLYAMAVTAVLSSYGIRWGDRLWRVVARAAPARELPGQGTADGHPIVLLGAHRTALALIDELEEDDAAKLAEVLVIDFNPETLKALASRGVAGHFGDLGSMDTLHHVHLHRATTILSTIPDMLLKGTDNRELVRVCRALAPEARIVATADTPEQAETLRAEGASEVILPHRLQAEHLAGLL